MMSAFTSMADITTGPASLSLSRCGCAFQHHSKSMASWGLPQLVSITLPPENRSIEPRFRGPRGRRRTKHLCDQKAAIRKPVQNACDSAVKNSLMVRSSLNNCAQKAIRRASQIHDDDAKKTRFCSKCLLKPSRSNNGAQGRGAGEG